MKRRGSRHSTEIEQLGEQSPSERHSEKPRSSQCIRQAICHWLLWCVLVLLVLCLPNPLAALGQQMEPLVVTPESLLAPLVEHTGIGERLFSWVLERSRRRRTIQLPGWISRLIGLWALIRRMSNWSIAQWVGFLSGSQIARFVGGILFLYPILKELKIAEIVDAYCPT